MSRVWAEGDNAFGQLGLDPSLSRMIRTLTETSGLSGSAHDPVIDIACGAQHVAALSCAGTVLTAGLNDKGQLGFGSVDLLRHWELKPASLPAAKVIGCGAFFTVAATEEGIYTWGYDSYQQLGREGDKTTPAPVVGLPDGECTQLACGWDFVVAVIGGEVFTWGRNNYGQLGIGDTVAQTRTPTRVPGLPEGSVEPVVAAGSAHAVCLVDGQVWAWGDGQNGELGNGCRTIQFSPVRVVDDNLRGSIPVCIAAGYEHTAMVSDDGRLWVWGDGADGKLAVQTQRLEVPTACPDIEDAVSVVCGTKHTVVLTAAGKSLACGGKYGSKFSKLAVDDHCKAQARRFGGFDDHCIVFLLPGGSGSRCSDSSPQRRPRPPARGPPAPAAKQAVQPPAPPAAPAAEVPETSPRPAEAPLSHGGSVHSAEPGRSESGGETGLSFTYQVSKYKQLLDELEKRREPRPDREDVKMAVMETALYVATLGDSAPTMEMRDFYKALSRECDGRDIREAEAAGQKGGRNIQETDSTQSVQQVSAMVWASKEEVRVCGGEHTFSWMVNRAIRHDDHEMLVKVMPFIRGLNSFCARERTKKQCPISWPDELYRGSGLVQGQAAWYSTMVQNKIRIPAFFSATPSSSVADEFARIAGKAGFEPVKYTLNIDSQHKCWYVNFIDHGTIDDQKEGEIEFLFAPYSCFLITGVSIKEEPTWTTGGGHQGPHEIFLDVVVDNEIERDDLPVAFWT